MKTQKKLWMKMMFVPLIFICLAAVSQFRNGSATDSAYGEIRFVKGDAVSLSFDVNLRQVPEKGCQLRIADQAGEVIFEKRIASGNYRETYKIERGNLSKITFEATGRGFRFEESFNLHFRMEEKIEVTKL
jgi:hypothetical protein